MPRWVKRESKKKGLPPGALVYVGDHTVSKISVNLIDYNKTEVIEKKINKIEDCLTFSENKDTVTWVDIEGISDPKLLEEIGDHFGIHRLFLEDVLNTGHRPKVEELNDLLFVLLKAAYLEGRKKRRVVFEQFGLFLGENFVLSFQEYPGDIFDSVKNRIRKSKGRVRRSGPDYLFYALMDSVVDSYQLVIESLGEQIESLELRLLNLSDKTVPRRINSLKNELLFLKKAVTPARDAIAQIRRSQPDQVQEFTFLFFSDLFEHAVQSVDTINDYRDMLNGFHDVYSINVSQRMNEVMKVLTVFASIFIPLTFIVGVYGMNFEYIPELKWKWGYFICWIFMILVTSVLLWNFKKKKWI